MSEPSKNPFEPFFDEFRKIVREEIAAALDKKKPSRLQFSTREAAEMLGLPESWLAAKARAGEIPFRQLGHYRLFSLQDIDAIMAQSAVENGSIPMIYNGHDGKKVQADSPDAGVEPVAASEAPGSVAEHGRALGPGREADSGPGRTLHEAPSRD